MHLNNAITEVTERAQPLPEALGSIRLLWTGDSSAETLVLYALSQHFHTISVTLPLRSLEKTPIRT